MAEVCLTELGRPPGPEMENCTDRESYSLAAGNKEYVFLILFYAAGHTIHTGQTDDLVNHYCCTTGQKILKSPGQTNL